jgi:hypothetical protein
MYSTYVDSAGNTTTPSPIPLPSADAVVMQHTIDTLDAALVASREQAEQWRAAYWNEVARTDKLVHHVILLTTLPIPVSTVETPPPTPQDGTSDLDMPLVIVQAIGHRSFDEATRRQLIEWAEKERANGADPDAIAQTILQGAMRSESQEEYIPPDEPEDASS